MLQRLMIKIYGSDWKTSLNGDLNAVMWACAFISSLTAAKGWPTWALTIPGTAGSIAAFLRLLVGRLQKDSKGN